jgi:phospholipid/cholesterol/gamma-HCH transport system ATP-binding protein
LDSLILQLRDALNMTIVIITHEMESAFHVADRITILNNGKQIVTGTKDEIRSYEDERIVNMLNRMPAVKEMDVDDYIHQLKK